MTTGARDKSWLFSQVMIPGREAVFIKRTRPSKLRAQKKRGLALWRWGFHGCLSGAFSRRLQNDEQEEATEVPPCLAPGEPPSAGKNGNADFISVLKKRDVKGKTSGRSGCNCMQPNEVHLSERKEKTQFPLLASFLEVPEKGWVLSRVSLTFYFECSYQQALNMSKYHF